jgi:hypothetical protein
MLIKVLDFILVWADALAAISQAGQDFDTLNA